MRKTTLSLVLLLSLFAVSAFAQDEGWRNRRGYRQPYNSGNMFELTPFGGYRYGGTIFADQTDLFTRDVDVANSVNWGVSAGVPIGNTPLKLELLVDRSASHLETGGGLFDPSNRVGDIDVTYYHAGIQIPFATSRSAEPFLLFSAGVANLDPHISNVSADNRFSAAAGVGVKLPVSRNLSLRIDARGYFTSLGSEDRSRNCSRCSYDYEHDLYQGETNVGLVFKF
ncbi:MAG: outer membrane beta-barrel protein [Acidobacteria bacterium]|nr:outer membrane beta-barrel protein [Acidobacteriota bacterium]